MASDSDKINYLFKKSLYKPHTNKTFKYYEENTANFNTNVLNKDIFVQEIPEDPSWNTGDVDTTGVIQNYTNLSLSLIPDSDNDGTLGAFYSLDVCGNNLLEDTIPYRFSKLADDTFPYRYILKYNTGTSTGTKIQNSQGDWVFDEKNGIIKFYGSTINIGGTDLSDNTKLTLSFKKYIGQKGFIKSDGGVNKYVIPYDISVNEIRCNRIIKDTVNNIHVTGDLDVNGVIKYKDDDINQKIYDIFDLENIIFNSTW